MVCVAPQAKLIQWVDTWGEKFSCLWLNPQSKRKAEWQGDGELPALAVCEQKVSLAMQKMPLGETSHPWALAFLQP